MIGTIQATEAVKVLLGIGDPLIGRLLTYDALGMRFREVKLRRDPKCPLCGQAPTITDLSIHREGSAACAVTTPDQTREATPPSYSPGGHGKPAEAHATR